MKRAYSLLVVAVAALTLAACGGGPKTTGHGQDVMFAQMMIPHHQQGITMAKMADMKATSPEVKQLAAQIEKSQGPEIQKMTGWLTSWGQSTSSGHSMQMDDGMGMMSDEDMKKLGTLSGSAFDKSFLQMMIKHHQGAISMAKTEKAKGSSADAKALADHIVTSQSAEIATMQKLLG